MKTIKDLDVNKIEKRHLIILKPDLTLFQRRTKSPVEFSYNGSIFTTAVPKEDLTGHILGTDSGISSLAFDKETMFEETKNRKGNLKVYEVKIKKEISLILDLDLVCKEQDIEWPYLKIWSTGNQRNQDEEKELMKLYGLFENRDKRINGVQYTSRHHPTGQCVMFFDTLQHIDEYLFCKDITDQQ